jgi:hypothetical protein
MSVLRADVLRDELDELVAIARQLRRLACDAITASRPGGSATGARSEAGRCRSWQMPYAIASIEPSNGRVPVRSS